MYYRFILTEIFAYCKKVKLVLSGDFEKNLGHFHELQELFHENLFETEGESKTAKFCLINFRSVQNKYQEIVDF